jgi:hypothetical protein
MKLRILISFIFALSACTGKDTIVRPHEQKIDQQRSSLVGVSDLQVRQSSVESTMDLLKSLGANPSMIQSQILKPLEQEIINASYISNPENITANFAPWLVVYTEALKKALGAKPQAQAAASLDEFIKLSLRNCDENLNGCSSIKTFRLSSNSSYLVVYKANLLGKQIDICEQEKKNCEELVREKYRLLIHANNLNSSQLPNVDFIVSYIEHSHLVEKLPNTSVVRRNHAQTFNTLVQFFDPDKTTQEVRCKIIKNFDIWTYSRLSLGASRQSMKKLFDLASRCDLYDENKRITENFKSSIAEIQLGDVSSNGVSFFSKMKGIQQDENKKKLFSGFLSAEILTRATQQGGDGKTIDNSFYDEYFFVLDRLYNGHISIEDAQQILLAANRSYDRLLEVFDVYVKMQLISAIADTKDYIQSVLSQDESMIASDKIFEQAIENSESFAQRLRALRSNMQALQSAIRVVFEKPGLATEKQKNQFEEVKKQIRHLPSTIKYIATYPAMMSLAHFLAKQEGTRKAKAWWGGEITFSSSTVYEEMWKGIEKPWFYFSDDEPLNKFYLIYAFDYAVRTDFISIQKSDEGQVISSKEKLNDYVQTLIGRYLKNERDALSQKYNDDLIPSVNGPMLNTQKILCEYELDPKKTQVPSLNKNLEDLRFQLHSGQGRSATTNYSDPSRLFFEKSGPILAQINDKIIPKIQVISALIRILEKNGLPQDVIATAKEEVSKTDKLIAEIISSFSKDVKYHMNCLRRLHLVEAYYQYLAYESERVYLSETWRRMKSLQNLDGQILLDSIDGLNNQTNMYRDNNQVIGTNADQIYFDRITSKKTFIYSGYDILIRLKNHLVSGSIHRYADARLEVIEQDWKKKFSESMTKPLLLKRDWQIQSPPILDESEIVSNRKNDATLNWTASEEEFVNQGLRALRGFDLKSHVQWYLTNNQELDPWKKALETIIYIYIAQDAQKNKENLVTTKDLMAGMKNLISMAEMNDIDVQLATVFGYTSKIPIDKLRDILVDGGMRETLHPYTFLYENFKTKIAMNPAILEMKPAQLTTQGTLLADAYLLSLNLNNEEYRIYFSTHEWLEDELKAKYTKISQTYLQKIDEMAKAFEQFKNDEEAKIVYRVDQGRMIRLNESSKIPLLNNLIHPDRVRDMRAFMHKFTQKSENIYNTQNIGEKRD